MFRKIVTCIAMIYQLYAAWNPGRVQQLSTSSIVSCFFFYVHLFKIQVYADGGVSLRVVGQFEGWFYDFRTGWSTRGWRVTQAVRDEQRDKVSPSPLRPVKYPVPGQRHCEQNLIAGLCTLKLLGVVVLLADLAGAKNCNCARAQYYSLAQPAQPCCTKALHRQTSTASFLHCRLHAQAPIHKLPVAR